MAQDEAKKFFDEGNSLFGESIYRHALTAFNKSLAIDPKNVEAWILRGISLHELGRHQKAMESLDKALAIDPGSVAALNIRGTILEHLGRYQEAINSYEKALKLNPNLSLDLDFKNAALDQLEAWLKARRPPSPYVELYKEVAATEERLHLFIRHRLQKALGENEAEWWVQGVPLPIRQECVKRREEGPRREPPYNYTDLIDLKDIMDKQWRHFEPDFQQVKGQFKSKKDFLDSLARLNEIRRIVMHPVRGIPTGDDIDFARHMRGVIENFTGPG